MSADARFQDLTPIHMSEDVARAEFESLLPRVRIVRNPSRMIRIGPNVLVRAGDIKRVKLVKLGDEDDPVGGVGDDEDMDSG